MANIDQYQLCISKKKKKNYIFSNKRTSRVKKLLFIGKKLKNYGGLWSGCRGGPSLLGKPPY